MAAPHSEQAAIEVGPDVGPTSAFHSTIPTGMHGPTRIFWAKLPPFSPVRPHSREAARGLAVASGTGHLRRLLYLLFSEKCGASPAPAPRRAPSAAPPPTGPDERGRRYYAGVIIVRILLLCWYSSGRAQ